MNETTTRADQIQIAFENFHHANPSVWQFFKSYTFDVVNSGRKHYSADAICHRIRWYKSIEEGDGEFKINNNFTAYYARMFDEEFPKHKGFFRNRRRASKGKLTASADEYNAMIQEQEERERMDKLDEESERMRGICG